MLNDCFVNHLIEMSEARLRLLRSQASPSLGIASRKPQRITITIPWSTYQVIAETSSEQGRSLSNTAAYWLERQAELFRDKAA